MSFSMISIAKSSRSLSSISKLITASSSSSSLSFVTPNSSQRRSFNNLNIPIYTQIHPKVQDSIKNMKKIQQQQQQQKLTSLSLSSSSTSSIQPSKNFSTDIAILDDDGEIRVSPLSSTHSTRSNILESTSFLLMNGHTAIDTLCATAQRAISRNPDADLIFVPSGERSAIEASRHVEFLSSINYIFTDIEEILALSDGWSDSPEELEIARIEKNLSTVKSAAGKTLKKMNPKFARILIAMGNRGTLLATKRDDYDPQFHDYPCQKTSYEIKKSTASFDCLAGAYLTGILDGLDDVESTSRANQAVFNLLTQGRLEYPLLSQFESSR